MGIVCDTLTFFIIQAVGASSVYAVHIDNGFMRKNESQQVAESLGAVGLKLTGKVHFSKCTVKTTLIVRTRPKPAEAPRRWFK